MPEEEYTPGKYSIIPLMVPHSILIHTCFYVFIKDIISEKLQCKLSLQCKLDHIRVPRQSLCRKFQIIWGFFHPAKGRRQKKREKSGQADRLGRPPLPRSGQENVKNSRQVVIFGVILPFYKG